MSKIMAQKYIKKAKESANSFEYEDAAHACISAIRAAKKSKSFALAGKAFHIIEKLPTSSIIGGLKKNAAYMIFDQTA